MQNDENPDSKKVIMIMEKILYCNFFYLSARVPCVQGYFPKVIVTGVPRFSILSTFLKNARRRVRALELS